MSFFTIQPMNLMLVFTSVQMAGCFLTSQFDLKRLVKAFGVLAKNLFQVFWFPDKAEQVFSFCLTCLSATEEIAICESTQEQKWKTVKVNTATDDPCGKMTGAVGMATGVSSVQTSIHPEKSSNFFQ